MLCFVGVQGCVEAGRPVAGAIGAPHAFDLHHAGSGEREQPAAERPRPERREIEHERRGALARGGAACAARGHTQPGRRDAGAGAGLRHGEAEQAGARDDLGDVPLRDAGRDDVPGVGGRALAALEPRRNQRAILVARETHRDPAVGRAQEAAAPARGDRAAAGKPEVRRALAEQRRSVEPVRARARSLEREARLRRQRAERVERGRGAGGERRGREARRFVRAPGEQHRSRARPRERRVLEARRSRLGADRRQRGEESSRRSCRRGACGGRLPLASPGLNYDTPTMPPSSDPRDGIHYGKPSGMWNCRDSRLSP